jgi:signal transduction histidine kinase
MQQKEVFINIYERITGWRFLLIVLLFIFGGFFISYTDIIVSKLEEREQTYVRLYVSSLESLISNDTDASTDIKFLTEVLDANKTIPAIYVDENNEIAFQKNIIPDSLVTGSLQKIDILKKELAEMRLENKPIPVMTGNFKKGYVYYRNSFLIKQLRYFPIVQLIAFLILGALTYLAVSSARKAEQNRVWVGLAKETAHQLGTPISALMGWIELLKLNPEFDQSIAIELQKDVERLDTVTKRFSSIGSVPQMNNEAIVPIVIEALAYLQKRISTKVKIDIKSEIADNQEVVMNRNLLEWVLENLCKNAVDAMGGIGSLNITMIALPKNRVAIDIADTGKGITSSNLRKVFNPGFSTKKRGWGLGLTLAKRIIENYHQGKLFVKETQLGRGTTFRIILRGKEVVV